ncbi:MAG TPA: SOS response-associated peptidase [Dongiaceae bacterium]|nr:SOS response-associated peptidase [Dongiaceae bacterium]
MCGRFILTTPPQALEELFEIRCEANLAPRYNIAPTQQASVIGLAQSGQRELRAFHWGLVPHWAKDISQAASMINARSETLAQKPAFREAFARRRCLIPADGFYEWATRPDGGKQPYLLTLADGACFAFAGLWEGWRNPAGEIHRSFTIITTTATAELEDLHHRMPVILPPAAYGAWLDPATSREAAQAMLRPYLVQSIARLAVGGTVNNVRRDDESCVLPAPATDPAPLFDQDIRRAI